MGQLHRQGAQFCAHTDLQPRLTSKCRPTSLLNKMPWNNPGQQTELSICTASKSPKTALSF